MEVGRRRCQLAVGNQQDQAPLGTPTPSLRHIERAVNFLISLCLGTAWISPVLGFFQIEWLDPSRSSRQPCSARCASKATLFTRPRL